MKAAALRVNGIITKKAATATIRNNHGENVPQSTSKVAGSAKIAAPTTPLKESRAEPPTVIVRSNDGHLGWFRLSPRLVRQDVIPDVRSAVERRDSDGATSVNQELWLCSIVARCFME